MHFHIARPQGGPYLYFCLGEVWTCLFVVQSRIKDFEWLFVGCVQFFQREDSMFPRELKEIFQRQTLKNLSKGTAFSDNYLSLWQKF